MRLEIGRMAALYSGITVYITEINENEETYTGYDVDNGKNYVTFKESDIAVTI